MDDGRPVVLLSDPSCVADVRRLIRKELASQDETLVESICLVASEMASNAILHGQVGTPFFRWAVGDTVALLEAHSGAPFTAPVPVECPDEHEENGRGLFLIGSITPAWGSRPCSKGDGTVFWAAVRFPE